MDLDEEYLISLYQTERVIKQTDDITVEVVKNTQTGDLEIKKSLSEKYKPLKDIYYALRNVDHKHIVKIIDVFEFETSLIVIEEYIQGRTLAEHLKNPVDKKTAIEWIEQLCEALDFLHSQSSPIIHRDLKPSNIMLQRGQVILIDFNIARTIKHNSTKDTHLIGTSGYASPEQYGFAQTDARSDIYSLGVIFRECLQGNTEKWESIIKKCTAIDPENRYQTAREVLSAIKGKKRHTGKIALITVLLVASIWGMLRLTTPDIDLNVGGVVEESTVSTHAEPSLPSTDALPQNTSSVSIPANNKDRPNDSDKTPIKTNPADTVLPQDNSSVPLTPNYKIEANDSVKKPAEKEQVESPTYHRLGDVYYWSNTGDGYSNNLDRNIEYYSKTIAADPKNVIAYYNRGVSYFYKGQYDLAIADYNKVMHLGSKDEYAYYGRGIAYAKNGKYDAAIADYNQAILLNSQNELFYYYRGNAHLYKSQYDLAIADYSEAIQLKIRDYRFYSNRGNAYFYKGQYDLAIADYDRAIQFNPQNKYAYLGRGSTYVKKKQYDLALVDFDRVLELDPQNKAVAASRQEVLKILNKL